MVDLRQLTALFGLTVGEDRQPGRLTLLRGEQVVFQADQAPADRDAGSEFAVVHRFRDVVVGASREAANDVVLFGAPSGLSRCIVTY